MEHPRISENKFIIIIIIIITTIITISLLLPCRSPAEIVG
jgi:hypothetical protein